MPSNKQVVSQLIIFWSFLYSLLMAPQVLSKEKILVGLAHFPPFIIHDDGKVKGLAADMLELMNVHQSDYEFVGVPTLPNTRHQIFDLGRYDMSMFDSLEWGWEGREVDASEVYLSGGEVYITQAVHGRGQSYFDDFRDKTIVGIEGYHYSFAGFNSDPDYLVENFNMKLTRSNLGSIQLILAGNRGDIAVVTQSYLAMYLNKNPSDRAKLLISEKFDQVYQHRIILRRNMALTIDKINSLLSELKTTGQLDALWSDLKLNNSE